MPAVIRTKRQRGKSFSEFLRIARTDCAITDFASPQGKPAIDFLRKEIGDRRVVFENVENPFPHRIIYWREG